MRVLVLGVTGMLGNAVFRALADDSRYEAWGTLRGEQGRRFFPDSDQPRLVVGIDVLSHSALVGTLNRTRPEVVVNAVGVVKQLSAASNPLDVLPLNAMFPHQLAGLCSLMGSRVIHVSSDCVFSGRKGSYRESDQSDAEDLYGRSKFIGELLDFPHAITIRTSIIGHELASRHGLLEWFLSQEAPVRGYARAIFSGLPTVELARVIRDLVLPRPDLSGLYHVSAAPVSKLELLRLIARVYSRNVSIATDSSVVVDRSLNSDRFERATGYVAPPWLDLITLMHDIHTRQLGATGSD
jgi:dTDP-4-dehydrorhamnose reductase